MLEWRLYYEDGSTFGSNDGGPDESPVWGIVVIGQRTGDQYDKVLCSGVPWYVFRSDLGFWQELDVVGFHDVLFNNAHNVAAVRPGRYVPSDKFKESWKRAREWVNVSQCTGRAAGRVL